MTYFKILDHPRNVSKTDLSVSPNSVSNQWDKNLSDTTLVYEKSWEISKYLNIYIVFAV